MRIVFILIFTLLISCISSVYAQPLRMTVADVGAGLCTITEMPEPENPDEVFYMVYDAGFGCLSDVQQIIPADQEIDLLVLSHNDTDHIARADDIMREYEVARILWTGFVRQDVATWRDVKEAIDIEVAKGAELISLSEQDLPIGTTWIYGETYITFLSGFEAPPAEWGFSPSDHSEYRNAGSIVLRVVHHQCSILLTGDAVGRMETDSFPADGVIAAEAFILQNRFAIPVDSDVLIASHHGGNDASSVPFIEAVSPEYVIFPAGSRDNYGHPRTATAERFLSFGVSPSAIFRTDRGDDESHPEHWEPGGNTGINDPSGDDDIRITIENGIVSVAYLQD